MKSQRFILNDFAMHLEINGYANSTMYDYAKVRIPHILLREDICINYLMENIHLFVYKYDSYGKEADYGNRSNRAYINALKRFKQYVFFVMVNDGYEF